MRKHILSIAFVLFTSTLLAHPMPNSVVSLSVLQHAIEGEAKMPLIELENAVHIHADTSLTVNNSFFKSYFSQHIKATSGNDTWITTVDDIQATHDVDNSIGNYQEVVVHFTLTPQNIREVRQFVFDYDAIVHQVVTHKILVFLKDDWKNGVHEKSMGQPIGIIETNFKEGKFVPLTVNLDEGSYWKGFTSMVRLGMQHIKEGTDHLLFLITLLLPATLLANKKKWTGFAGTKHSLVRLLKIVTAFTIGHSITLLIGALGLFTAPEKGIEILIAVSILISAIHALRPIFPGKEFYVAAGFGLIHGLAFASVLSNMNLDAGTLALSILGFNAGIEVMQLFIIAIIIPWLVLLSQTPLYKYFRVTGAALSAIAASAWIVARSLGTENFVTNFITRAYPYALWLVIAIAVLSVMAYLLNSNYFINKLHLFKQHANHWDIE